MTNRKKYIAIITSAIAAAILIAWIASRWSVWFHTPDEPSYTIGTGANDIQLSLSRDRDTLHLSWRSSALYPQAATTWVDIDDNDTSTYHATNRRIISDGGKAIFYNATIPVKPGKQYKYWISSSANACTSDTFHTHTASADSIRILIVGDIQDKRYTGTDSLIRSIAEHHNPNYIITLGDLIERPHQQYWDRYFTDFDSIATSIPAAMTLGNHDYHKGIDKYPDIRSFFTFPHLLPNKANTDTATLYATRKHSLIGLSSIDFHTAKALFIDTNQPLKRLRLQRRQLADIIVDHHGSPLFVMMHHAPHSAISPLNNLIIKWFYHPILDNEKVKIVYAAHEHTLCHLTPQQTNAHYHQIIQHFSAKDYSSKGLEGRHYTILTVTPTSWTSTTYNLNHTPVIIVE